MLSLSLWASYAAIPITSSTINGLLNAPGTSYAANQWLEGDSSQVLSTLDDGGRADTLEKNPVFVDPRQIDNAADANPAPGTSGTTTPFLTIIEEPPVSGCF